MFTTEYFGPILAVHVYDDADFERVVDQMESASPYGLTGAVIAQDRAAIAYATEALRFAAGNFYVNDKPTGAVVGQQPFGGARGSGTNDKAGAAQNLMRWTSTRVIKETFVPATRPPLPAHEVSSMENCHCGRGAGALRGMRAARAACAVIRTGPTTASMSAEQVTHQAGRAARRTSSSVRPTWRVACARR